MRVAYILLGILGLILALALLFPDAVRGEGARMHLLYVTLLLVLVASSITLKRTDYKRNARNAAIWAAIIIGLMLAYELLAKMSG